MQSNREPDPALGQQLNAMLRSLPPRRAPQALEQRVLAELQRRAAMPWWRRQVAHWPRGARLLFGLVAVSVMVVSLVGSRRLSSLVRPDSLAAVHAIQSQPTVLFWHTLVTLPAMVISALPVDWLEIAAVLAAVAYVFLMAVGTAAWRLLYLQR